MGCDFGRVAAGVEIPNPGIRSHVGHFHALSWPTAEPRTRWCWAEASPSQLTPHPARSGWRKRRQRATLSPRERLIFLTSTRAGNDGPLPGEKMPDGGPYRPVLTGGGPVRGFSVP